jgi:hypothetical protein
VRNTAQYGFESALHEDSRYRRLGGERLGKRIFHAVSYSVLAYKPDGSVEPMYGRMAAGVVATLTASTWHPQTINTGYVLSGVGFSALDRAQNNLVREFEPEIRNYLKRPIALGQRTLNHLLRK